MTVATWYGAGWGNKRAEFKKILDERRLFLTKWSRSE